MIGLRGDMSFFLANKMSGKVHWMEVGGSGKGFIALMKNIPEETIPLLSLDIFLFVCSV